MTVIKTLGTINSKMPKELIEKVKTFKEIHGRDPLGHVEISQTKDEVYLIWPEIDERIILIPSED